MKTATAQTLTKDVSKIRWLLGFAIASLFSITYILTPLYITTFIFLIVLRYPPSTFLLFGAPLLLSAAIPSRGLPWIAKYMTPMLDYFNYSEYHECTNDDLRVMMGDGKKIIIAMQPHGVVSFCSMCSWVAAPPDIREIQTAVASVLLVIPILKHVMGIFGLTSASAGAMRKRFQQESGIRGSLVLHIGGIAELFRSSRSEERLYLMKRKGFIKVALREKGVDIIPVYLFGNTSVLTVLKNKTLENLSRKIQMSLTYFWGKWFLPIPRDDELLYVRGKPLGLPYIPEPTDEDVNKWHAKYCEEVTRLFNDYKEKVPAYKHKKLYID